MLQKLIHEHNIMHQIVCMFFSTNGSAFQATNPDLVKFVLNPIKKHLPPKFRIFTFYNYSPYARQTGVVGNFNIFTGRGKVFSEVAYPPLGYVMTLDSSPPDQDLFDITFFADSDFNDYREITLQIPYKEVYTGIPGDYRAKSEIKIPPQNEKR